MSGGAASRRCADRVRFATCRPRLRVLAVCAVFELSVTPSTSLHIWQYPQQHPYTLCMAKITPARNQAGKRAATRASAIPKPTAHTRVGATKRTVAKRTPAQADKATTRLAGGRRGPRTLSDEHKAQLEIGRAEGKAVRSYLNALAEAPRPRGRRRTPESIEKEFAEITSALRSATGFERLQLLQRRTELESSKKAFGAPTDLVPLEREFVKVAKGYSQRRGITYSVWREAGVSSEVLARASIFPSRGGRRAKAQAAK